MAGDPYYNSVKLLLPLDGENNSTTIVDKSKTPNAITASGDAIISTAQSKFGGSSLKLNGSSAFVETPYISQFDPATNDWTFEAFLYCLGYNSSSSSTICGTYSWASEGGTNNAGWQIGLSQTSGLITFGWGNNSWDSVLNTTTALPLNQWKHLALCKYGSVWTFYLDGISIGNATYATSITYPKTKLKIGSNYHSSFGNYYFYNGYVDDLRLTAGVSRYTSNFTPPAAPFDAFLPLVRSELRIRYLAGPISQQRLRYLAEAASQQRARYLAESVSQQRSIYGSTVPVLAEQSLRYSSFPELRADHGAGYSAQAVADHLSRYRSIADLRAQHADRYGSAPDLRAQQGAIYSSKEDIRAHQTAKYGDASTDLRSQQRTRYGAPDLSMSINSGSVIVRIP